VKVPADDLPLRGCNRVQLQIETVQGGRQLLVTLGSLTTFSIDNAVIAPPDGRSEKWSPKVIRLTGGVIPPVLLFISSCLVASANSTQHYVVQLRRRLADMLRIL
jgi:hypothetical protein